VLFAFFVRLLQSLNARFCIVSYFSTTSYTFYLHYSTSGSSSTSAAVAWFVAHFPFLSLSSSCSKDTHTSIHCKHSPNCYFLHSLVLLRHRKHVHLLHVIRLLLPATSDAQPNHQHHHICHVRPSSLCRARAQRICSPVRHTVCVQLSCVTHTYESITAHHSVIHYLYASLREECIDSSWLWCCSRSDV
jgi:hypothetical protein